MTERITRVANRYEIDSLIGQGGMADVYLAQDTILNRMVAIKVLREKMSEDPMTLVRFQREASAASKLSHPNVVDIYDVGESEGMHYIVMEYIRGRTLKQLIQQRGALSVKEAIHIMTQLTSAIKHAHLHNIIHRDIKPQNILVKDDGTIKISDFGIAVANDAVQLTLNNAVMGSAHYLAPETAQGKDATEQVDIYSLGIVFYELLTGKVPFSGKTPTEIAIKHLRQPMPYVRDFNPDIPQSVENIILKATAKVSSERYDHANLMLYDLEHCLDWEYRNMDRIEIETPVVSNVDVNDGHVTVQYTDQQTQDPVIKEKKKSFLSLPAKLGIVLILCGICALSAIGTGFIHVDGMFGYKRMPNVNKMTQEEAISILKADNFNSISFDYAVSDKVDKDHIISANHKPGELIHTSEDIVVTISKGPSFLVKDYTGEYLDDVLYELEQSGVQLDVQVEYSNAAETNPGIIMEQSLLTAGERIDPDSNRKIKFIVSQYPTIKIPEELIGMDIEEGKDLLNELGVAVNTRQSGGGGTGKIIQVNPPVGTTYTQEGSESVVTLYYD